MYVYKKCGRKKSEHVKKLHKQKRCGHGWMKKVKKN